MKKFVVMTLALMLFASTVFAIDFAPQVMKLSAADAIQYDFDGSEIDIPFTVSGRQGTVYFLIYTKDKGESIGIVNNGNLGWHYVNKIDTCMYLAPAQNIDVGNNLVEWNGMDNDGGIVPAGEYTYYMWAYDHVNLRIPASRIASFNGTKGIQIQTLDEDGAPLANPVLYPINYKTSWAAGSDPFELVQKRWVLGGDPEDETLLETTFYWGGNNSGYIALQPDNHNIFYTTVSFDYPNPGIYICKKYEWVPNGEAVLDVEWGEDGEYQYASELAWPHWETGVITDNQGTLYMGNQDISGVGTESELIYVDMEFGEEIRRVDLSEWWIDIGDGEAGGQSGGGPTTIIYNDGYIFASSHTTCMKTMMDPFQEDYEDLNLWVNQNGDYVGDHNFEETSERPWVCNDYNVAPFMYTTSADANQFSVFNANVMGAVTFGLIAPDGTGIGYLAIAGETDGSKQGQIFCDSGSSFDGIYLDNASTEVADDKGGTWYVSHDSIKGIITSAPIAVEDDTPAAYAVAQNSPNPFNPSTTISFTNAEAGNVSIDVFNVAGQKVDTIASEFMSVGNHSVTWDASGFSAGVYFYTVKSGDFSKTMKMTLLK